jgi:thiosulfate dehydrogenase
MRVFAMVVLGTSLLFADGVKFEAPKEYPSGQLGSMVRLGEKIAKDTNTHRLTRDYVGNDLTCANCHLSGDDGHVGTSKGYGSFIGTAAAFPAYSSRNDAVITLEDRVNECFLRSMNAKKPITDTKGSIALTAYIAWLSSDMKMQMNSKKPASAYNTELSTQIDEYAKLIRKATHQNYQNGEKIYKKSCAMCHGENGTGEGNFPPLWGKDEKGKWVSYNAGAGMSKLPKAALWLETNMPYKEADSLTKEQVVDVSIYINAQPRANFSPKDDDLPVNFVGYTHPYAKSIFESVELNFKDARLDLKEIKGSK